MAYLPTSSLKMGDWTDEDHQECLRLMHKAHGRGILKALVELVEQENDWSVISGRTTEGNMSDAAKRQRSEDEIKELKNVSPQKFVPCSSQPAYAPMPAVAAPTTLVHPGNEPVPAVQLPPGVTSIEKWGRTMVSFGKFMNKRTYMSLHLSQDQDDHRYKVWLSAHFVNGSPHLRDLVNYLRAMGDKSVTGTSDDKQVVMIPGTDVPRKLG